jgi:tRNA pseudouridine55 synthase
VLVLGVGRATRLLTFLNGVDKDYEATIRLGVETDTLDADGTVTNRHDMSGLDPGAVERAAASLTGDLLQVPPMVSAVKVEGRRLHELARAGVEVERRPRPVHVDRFEVSPTADPLCWRARVSCSSGTYVRALAADLGRALGGGAHLASLRRTRVGPFGIDVARDLEHLEVLDPVAAVAHLGSVRVGEELAGRVRHGAVLERSDLPGVDDPGPWAVLDPDGALLAVYRAHGPGRAKPAVVVAPAEGG